MKVGDYVRTNGGRIGKVTDLETYCNLVIDTDKGELDIQRIIKSSPNIIDLIQEGDYVNSYEVVGVKKDYIYFEDGTYYCKNYQIKSIVTKEQFKSMEYRIGE